ncbi:MAG TPA: hypothetical protein IAC60_06140 [Candidatus Enterosoma merdigallinarum]|nr:hypothetical protein [Candidatus Enterosoma merdigallinarum]
MKDIDDGTINQYKWLKIAQALILIVLGLIFVLTAWLSEDGVNNALSYCLGVVFAAYGTVNIVAGYLLHRTALNSPVFIGLLAIAFSVIFFYKSELLAQILSPFLITLLIGVSILLIVNGVDKILSSNKTKKKIALEKAKEDGKDFELIKRLGNSVHQDVKSAVIAFVVAALVIAMSVVYLYFYLTQKAQVEKYLVIAVGIATFILGIASMVSVLRKIRSTKDFLMEEKMKEQTPTYNDSDEVRNTDVRIIDISELKSKRTRRRKALPKPKAEEEGEKEEQSAVSGDGLDGD